jgi:hypothetical protein
MKKSNLVPALKLPKTTKAITIREMYKSLAETLLENNPEWYAKRRKQDKFYYIYKFEEQFDHRSGKRTHNAPVLVISYPQFREMVKVFYTEARTLICDGNVLVMGPKMGKIAGRRIENNMSKLKLKSKIDWKRTMSGPIDEETGRHKAVYKPLDETYCRIGWEKSDELKNGNITEFMPSRSNTEASLDPDRMGFANQFSNNLMNNPSVQLLYRFYKIK